MPTEVADPNLWARLGVGGILAFIITVIWLSREVAFYKREQAWIKEAEGWRTVIEKQWEMITELTKTASDDLKGVIESSTKAWVSVKTFLEARMSNGQ